MAKDSIRRRSVAILAVDIVGYSRLMHADEEGTLEAIKSRSGDILYPLVTRNQGRLFKEVGDGALVEFASTVAAVQCAYELQHAFAIANADQPADRQIVLRIGINHGDVMVDGSDLFGDSVNIAARLEAIANPGSILVSDIVYELVHQKVEMEFEDAGLQDLKNIADPVRVYRVLGVPSVDMPPPKAAADRPSIAVMPFSNLSGDPGQEYFSDGITEDIITELSRNRSFFVIARNSSFMFKGTAANVAEVARKLNVRYIVEGSFRKIDKRVRITAQLIEAMTGNHAWAERYDRDIEDILSVQDEVVEQLVWALAGRVTTAEIGRSKRRQRTQLDSYDLLLRGIEAYYQYTRQSITNAVSFFEQAVSADPKSARAWAWLADGYWFLSVFEADPTKRDLAFNAANRAIELGDSGGHAEATLSPCCWFRGEFDAAETYIEHAIELGPNNSATLVTLGYLRLWQGRKLDAISVGEKLLRLDPLNPGWVHELLFYAQYLLGDYATSLESFRKWNRTDHYRGHANVAACLAQLGRIEDAGLAWRRCIELKPGFTIEEYRRGSPYRRSEDTEQWIEGLRKAGIAE